MAPRYKSYKHAENDEFLCTFEGSREMRNINFFERSFYFVGYNCKWIHVV